MIPANFMPAIGNLASGLGKGLGDAIGGGGGGGPMVSGGTVDARSSFDGSGWTVSTGASKATGGARTGGADLGGMPAEPFGPNAASQAGFGWLPALLLLGVALAWKAGSK
jgi:hypothetical protein